MSAEKLKLGLLIDSFDVPAWLHQALEQIANSDYATFSVIFLKDNGSNDNHTSWFNQLWRNRRELAYEVFNKIDEKIFLRGPSAFKMINTQEILSRIPVVPVSPMRDGCIDVIKTEDAKRVQNLNLDILIMPGFQQVSEGILSAAKYGVWYYERCDKRMKRGGPPGFWEVIESLPITGAALLITKKLLQRGWVIYRSRFLTYPFSPARTRNRSFWASSSFLPRQINLLYRLGDARFFQETAKFNSEFDFYDRKKYQNPTNLESIRLYTRLLFRDLFELYQRMTRLESWYLMVGFSNNTSLSFIDFKKVVPPNDRFWADPQVIVKDDTYYIFVEEYFYKTHKGHISFIEMDVQGHFKDAVPVLETDYHLSYPFVFEYDHKYYMVPETAHNQTIDLYECVAFPNQWKFKMTLIDNVNAVDTTLFFYMGKWWLFTGITENVGAYPEVELFLFYSDELFTNKWNSHPQNPIVSDVTCARPAGRIFINGGKVYRPSQDCSKNYGNGFNIHEIMCLTETEYFERKVVAVKPDWDRRLIATHTFASAEGITVIDGLNRRSKLF